MICRSIFPGPSRCSCPTKSASVSGRSRLARGVISSLWSNNVICSIYKCHPDLLICFLDVSLYTSYQTCVRVSTDLFSFDKMAFSIPAHMMWRRGFSNITRTEQHGYTNSNKESICPDRLDGNEGHSGPPAGAFALAANAKVIVMFTDGKTTAGAPPPLWPRRQGRGSHHLLHRPHRRERDRRQRPQCGPLTRTPPTWAPRMTGPGGPFCHLAPTFRPGPQHRHQREEPGLSCEPAPTKGPPRAQPDFPALGDPGPGGGETRGLP